MEIKKAEFVKSSNNVSQCPESDMPEFAFIGRSNVGKSSLINALLDRKSLAKTFLPPGKTLLINHFIINKTWHLVDLPGYGYAQRSKTMRRTEPNDKGLLTPTDANVLPVRAAGLKDTSRKP